MKENFLDKNLNELKKKLPEYLFFEQNPNPSTATYNDPRFRRKSTDQEFSFSGISEDLTRVRNELSDQFHVQTKSRNREALLNLIHEQYHDTVTLVYKNIIIALRLCGIEKNLWEKIIHKVEPQTKGIVFETEEIPDQLWSLIEKELVLMIDTSGPICLNEKGPTIVTFHGAPGAGKTTSVFKVALQYQRYLDKKTAIISYEPVRPWAASASGALADYFQLPLLHAKNEQEIEGALENFADYDFILIDTDPSASASVASRHRAGGIIVISLETSHEDSMLAFHKYHSDDTLSILMTKLDLSKRPGSLVNIIQEARTPASYYTDGTDFLFDAHIADPELLAHLIVQKAIGLGQRQ